MCQYIFRTLFDSVQDISNYQRNDNNADCHWHNNWKCRAFQKSIKAHWNNEQYGQFQPQAEKIFEFILFGHRFNKHATCNIFEDQFCFYDRNNTTNDFAHRNMQIKNRSVSYQRLHNFSKQPDKCNYADCRCNLVDITYKFFCTRPLWK